MTAELVNCLSDDFDCLIYVINNYCVKIIFVIILMCHIMLNLWVNNTHTQNEIKVVARRNYRRRNIILYMLTIAQ